MKAVDGGLWKPTGSPPVSLAQVDLFQSCSSEIGEIKTGAAKTGAGQYGARQLGVAKVRGSEIRPAEITAHQYRPTKRSASQVRSS